MFIVRLAYNSQELLELPTLEKRMRITIMDWVIFRFDTYEFVHVHLSLEWRKPVTSRKVGSNYQGAKLNYVFNYQNGSIMVPSHHIVSGFIHDQFVKLFDEMRNFWTYVGILQDFLIIDIFSLLFHVLPVFVNFVLDINNLIRMKKLNFKYW